MLPDSGLQFETLRNPVNSKSSELSKGKHWLQTLTAFYSLLDGFLLNQFTGERSRCPGARECDGKRVAAREWGKSVREVESGSQSLGSREWKPKCGSQRIGTTD